MGKDTRPEYRGAWPRIRKAILERDNHTCQIRAARCTTHATHVDHIIPVTQGGPWWEPTNLRAACQNCNLGRIDHKRNERWRKANTHITLVVGPPYAGKTTHAKTHAKPGDIIIDYDEIKKGLQNLMAPQNLEATQNLRGTQNFRGTPQQDDPLHTMAMATRNSMLKALREGTLKTTGAFIISANPGAETIFPYHKIVVVDPGQAEVLARVATDPDSRHLTRLVHEWYRTRSRQGVTPTTSREW
jgi:hypothetical protein